MTPAFQVLADDLSGAAEIAGIAYAQGWKCKLYRAGATNDATEPSIPVFDLSTRDLPEIGGAWRECLRSTARPETTTFVKIDSVLRGQVGQIISAFKEAGQKVLLLPGNPESGRVCSDGQFTIDGIPLHQTDFANDPGNPATSSKLGDLIDPSGTLGKLTYVSGTCITELPESSIIVAQCASINSMQSWAKKALEAHYTVFGSADAFAAWSSCIKNSNTAPAIKVPTDKARLFIAGSNHPRNCAWRGKLETSGEKVHALGDSSLTEQITATLNSDKQAYLFTGNAFPIRTDVAALLANQAKLLIQHGASEWTICVDGGATAAAIAEKIGWKQFTVEHAYAKGIVRLAPPSGISALIVKPGSYEWPLNEFNPQYF